ncbi:MAG: hypothetical protein ACI9QD_001260 [Thermoproteota archaeon]|jgi:hypothetical protein
MNKIALVLFWVVFISNSFSNELVIESESPRLGDIVTARLILSDAKDYVKLEESKPFLKKFYLIEKKKTLENQYDLTLAIGQEFDGDYTENIVIGKNTFQIHVQGSGKKEDLKPEKKLIILNESIKGTFGEMELWKKILITTSIFVLVLIIGLFIYNKIKKRNIIKNLDIIKRKYMKKIEIANSRREYEIINKDFKSLVKSLNLSKDDYSDFLDVINEIQYKKEWSKVDEIRISQSFDRIRTKIC